MDWLIWTGAGVTLLGLGGLILAIRRAMAVRNAGLSESETRAALSRVVPLNLGSLMLSTLGLMLVVIGVVLS